MHKLWVYIYYIVLPLLLKLKLWILQCRKWKYERGITGSNHCSLEKGELCVWNGILWWLTVKLKRRVKYWRWNICLHINICVFIVDKCGGKQVVNRYFKLVSAAQSAQKPSHFSNFFPLLRKTRLHLHSVKSTEIRKQSSCEKEQVSNNILTCLNNNIYTTHCFSFFILHSKMNLQWGKNCNQIHSKINIKLAGAKQSWRRINCMFEVFVF